MAPAPELNVVVITIDTLRADALGVYGNSGGHSPRIDEFAEDAIVFTSAVTAIGTTHPSCSTIFTGLYPKHHGVRWNGDVLGDRFETLAEVLSDASYETAAFVSMSSLLSGGGLHQGMSTVSDPVTPAPKLMVRNGDEVNKMAIPWLASRNEDPETPFFLWLHYYEPHSPYRLTPFAREQLIGYEGPLKAGASVRTFYSLGHEIPWTAEETRAVNALYHGEVREADRLVGEVLDSLRSTGLLSRTIVVVTSDHGQALGEQGEVGHGFQLSQPVLHVPLIVRVPGLAKRQVMNRVSLVDLMPTLLELLDLPLPRGLDGHSLGSFLNGQQSLGDFYYFAEVRGAGNRLARIRERDAGPRDRTKRLFKFLEQDITATAIFRDHIKGVWKSSQFWLYDLEKDPSEAFPRKLEGWDPELSVLQDLASSYHTDQVETAYRELDEAVRKELESLGYLQ